MGGQLASKDIHTNHCGANRTKPMLLTNFHANDGEVALADSAAKGWAPTLGILMAVLALLLVFGVFYLADATYKTAVWWRDPFVLNRYYWCA